MERGQRHILLEAGNVRAAKYFQFLLEFLVRTQRSSGDLTQRLLSVTFGPRVSSDQQWVK